MTTTMAYQANTAPCPNAALVARVVLLLDCYHKVVQRWQPGRNILLYHAGHRNEIANAVDAGVVPFHVLQAVGSYLHHRGPAQGIPVSEVPECFAKFQALRLEGQRSVAAAPGKWGYLRPEHFDYDAAPSSTPTIPTHWSDGPTRLYEDEFGIPF